MLLLIHHLAVDHMRFETIHEEIPHILAGRPYLLKTPEPFRSFVALSQARKFEQSHRDYFAAMIGHVDGPTVPFGFSDTTDDRVDVEEFRMQVERDLGRRSRNHARQLGVSVASLFHVAWARVLGRLSDRDDVV